jgi:hypothetical protein
MWATTASRIACGQRGSRLRLSRSHETEAQRLTLLETRHSRSRRRRSSVVCITENTDGGADQAGTAAPAAPAQQPTPPGGRAWRIAVRRLFIVRASVPVAHVHRPEGTGATGIAAHLADVAYTVTVVGPAAAGLDLVDPLICATRSTHIHGCQTSTPISRVSGHCRCRGKCSTSESKRLQEVHSPESRVPGAGT